jgi:hypothetical protein
MERNEMERLARRRAGAKTGFIIHATVFVLVNAALFAINRQVGPQYAWSFWPLGGWAIGLAIHGLVVYGLSPGGSISRRLVDAELRKLEQRKAPGAR